MSYGQELKDWTQAALQDGFRHGGADPSQRLINGAYQAIIETTNPETPHDALTKAYISARAYAMHQTQGNPAHPRETGQEPVWMQRSLRAWLDDLFADYDSDAAAENPKTPRFPSIRSKPDADPLGSKIVDRLSAAAIDAITIAVYTAYIDEAQLDPEAPGQNLVVSAPYIGADAEPYQTIITAYFGARAAAAAQRLGRDSGEEMSRWFRQAAADYAAESWNQPETEPPAG